MNSRTRLVAALTCGLLVIGCTTAVAASTSTDVTCSITDNTLTCPLPPPPAPVTVTNTETATVTQQNTVTQTSTVTSTVSVPAGPETLFGEAVPANAADAEAQKVELGVKFKPAVDGVITGVRFYKGAGNTGTHTGSLWSGPTRVATVTFTAETDTGWQTAKFANPVIVKAGTEYIASYLAPVGHYAGDGGYAWPKTSGNLTGLGSLYKYGGGLPTETYGGSNYYVDVVFIATGTPTPPPATTAPTTTAPPSTTTAPTTPPVTPTGFPDETNTGVPAGTTLTAYTGPCTITAANTIIDAKTINCDITVKAGGLKITRSHINGIVNNEEGGASFTIEDSRVIIGNRGSTGVGALNYTAKRIWVSGGNRGMYCYQSCLIEDSYVHAGFRDAGGTLHMSGVRMGQGLTLRHSTVWCDAPNVDPDAGCSADLTGCPDFQVIQNNRIENNLFKASANSGYCAYGGSTGGKPYSGQTNNIVFRGNTWERGNANSDGGRGPRGCWYGPIADFDSNAPGNVWQNNKFDDGAAI